MDHRARSSAYNTEAVLWGAFIEQHIDEFAGDGKITVAALVMNNDFGKVLRRRLQGLPRPVADQGQDRATSTETIEPSAPTVTDPMTTLASKDPDVFIAMMAGTPCTQAITEAAENGMKETAKYLFTAVGLQRRQLRGQGQGRR